jgi:hypothetical protein
MVVFFWRKMCLGTFLCPLNVDDVLIFMHLEPLRPIATVA